MNSPGYSAFVIEDDKKQAEIFSEALSMADFKTEIIYDGSQAVRDLQKATPDLIVLDLHLPCISGDKILSQIQNSTHLKETKVILATADPQMANILQDKCDLVMIKPISFIQLRDLALGLFA